MIMNTYLNNRILLYPFFTFLIILQLVFVTGVLADHLPLKGLSGIPFSDPSKIQNMPEEWQKKPVIYGPSIKDADIVVTLNQNFNAALKPLINKFAESLPMFDARYIRTAYSRLNPSPKMKQEFECPSCGQKKEVEIPMTVNFFWSDQ